MNNQEKLKDEQKMKKVMKYIYEFAKKNNIQYITIDAFPYEREFIIMEYQFKGNNIINDLKVDVYDEEK